MIKKEGFLCHDVMIKVENTPLLALNFHIERGEITTLMGASGSGKSTFLTAIAGTLDPYFTLRGDFYCHGRPLNKLSPHRRNVGLLYQDPLLFPHLDVYHNLILGVPRSVSHNDKKQLIYSMLDKIGLKGYEKKGAHMLSGGQAARIALARTLLSEPDLLLLDEPFSKLDATLRYDMRDLVFRMAREKALPTLLVTHDKQDADHAGGEILSL